MRRRPLAGRTPLAHLPCSSTSNQMGPNEPKSPSQELVGRRRSALIGTAEKKPFLAGGRAPASGHANPNTAPVPPTRQPKMPAAGRGVPSGRATRVPVQTASLQQTPKPAPWAEPAPPPVQAGSSSRSKVPRLQLQKLQTPNNVPSRLSGKAPAASSGAGQTKIPRLALHKLETPARSAPTNGSGSASARAPRLGTLNTLLPENSCNSTPLPGSRVLNSLLRRLSLALMTVLSPLSRR